MALTIEEKLEILQLSRKFSYQKTAEEFNRLHPNRPQPIFKQTVGRIFRMLNTNGGFHRKKRSVSVQHTIEHEDLKDQVVQLFRENPHMSTRNAGIRMGVPHTSIWNILKELKFRPYKMAVHQKLKPSDAPNRKEFCEELLRMICENPRFPETILWTDEKMFAMNGCFNRQNFR